MKSVQSQVVFRNATSSALGRVTLAGFIRHSAGVAPFRRYGQYALVYLLDGSGRYRDTNSNDQAIGPGDLMFIFPKLGHAYGPGRGEHWTEFYLCFDGPVFDLWQTHGLLDPRQPVRHLEPIDAWLKKLEGILSAPRQPGFAPPLVEVCRLQQLLAEILTGAGNVAGPGDLQWAARACALLEADLERVVNLGALAAQLGMSYESLRKRFARVVGQPPARYRTARLIDRACELMQRGQISDKQIAEVLGFCDAFYFSRRFKQVTGQSPRQFRQKFAAR